MGAWHDAVDGPSIKSEGSEYLHGGSCQLSWVSSFAAVKGGIVSVGGFGRIDGLHSMGDTTYWSETSLPNLLSLDCCVWQELQLCNFRDHNRDMIEKLEHQCWRWK